MEKTLRVLGSEEGGHSHSHSHSHSVEGSTGHASGVELSHNNGELKVRKEKKLDKKDQDQDQDEERSSQNGPSKLSAYLNLFGDFVHNMYVPYLSFISLYRVAHSNVSALMASRQSVWPPRFDLSI